MSGVENVTRGLEGDARRPFHRRYKDRRGGGSDVRDADFRRYEEEVRTNFASANWNRGDIPLNYYVSPPLELLLLHWVLSLISLDILISM